MDEQTKNMGGYPEIANAYVRDAAIHVRCARSIIAADQDSN
jgi:hypothetical protein